MSLSLSGTLLFGSIETDLLYLVGAVHNLQVVTFSVTRFVYFNPLKLRYVALKCSDHEQPLGFTITN